LNRYENSLADFKRAHDLRPNYVEALFGLGNAARALRQHEEAFQYFSKALSIEPDRKYLAGDALHAAAQIADWTSYQSIAQKVREGVSEGRLICFPFVLLGLTSDAALQLSCARRYSETNYVCRPAATASPRRHRKIRLAYLSADFREHATATLLSELLEIHDRTRFSVIGISLASTEAGKRRQRIQVACDNFVDVSTMTDTDVAALMREMEIDIAVDLMGHTEHARTGIMALRPAPIQVNFLGYPGTMGTGFIDYLIADPVVIPIGSERYYTEKIVRLPNSYQVNDSKREIQDRSLTRSDYGLPDNGFVFCCFNGTFKINATMFDVWMHLLRCVEGSVLWMLSAGATVEKRLRGEAESRGIDSARLVFAPWTTFDEHLARHRAADLFLDTLPCNAHTTASDALWAGLPVLTCTGASFASRVAASLLYALNLPELVTSNISEYTAIAVQLARSPFLIGNLRRKLAKNRLEAPLFNTKLYRSQIEQAYVTMWNMHLRGDPPASFSVKQELD
jgi:predicted O-linked N-acetylglucosamine transferase (SPINDLY family)